MKARCAWQLRGQRSDKLRKDGQTEGGNLPPADYKASSTSNHFPVQTEKSKPPSEAAPKPQRYSLYPPYTSGLQPIPAVCTAPFGFPSGGPV